MLAGRVRRLDEIGEENRHRIMDAAEELVCVRLAGSKNQVHIGLQEI